MTQMRVIRVIGWACLAALGAISASGSVSAAPRPGFTIDPYLFVTSGDQIRLGWQYAANGAEPAEAREPAVFVRHGSGPETRVEPRRAGDLYFADLPLPRCGWGAGVSYRVSGMDRPQPIVDVPCPGSGAPARFSMIADAQKHPEFVEQISTLIEQFPGSAILSDGDLVQEGSDFSQWVKYFAAIGGVGGSRVTLPAMGNHEYRIKRRNHIWWQDFFQKPAHDAHYSFFIGSAHVIVINSCFEDDKTLAESQLPWLIQELAVPAQWKLVMFHHPPYSKSIANLRLAPKKEHVTLQKLYVPLFEAYGVDVVLNGHTHVFERSVRNGIQYLTAGPAGGIWGYFYANNPYFVTGAKERTVSHFEATDRFLNVVTLNLKGERIDSFILEKPASAQPRLTQAVR